MPTCTVHEGCVVKLIRITCTCWYDVAVTVPRLFSGLSYWEPRACLIENRPDSVSLHFMPMQPFLTHTWVMQLMQYGCRNEKQDVPPLTPAALADSVSCLYRPQYIWMSWLKRHSRQGCRPDLHQISSTSFLSTLFHLFGVPKPCHRRKPLSSCLGTCIKQNGGAILLCLWSASGGSNRAWWMEWTCVKG